MIDECISAVSIIYIQKVGLGDYFKIGIKWKELMTEKQ